MFYVNKTIMDLDFEKIIQAAVVGVVACHVLAMLLRGQKIPQKKLAMPILSSMAASYILGNKSLSLRGDENLQVFIASAAAAYMYGNM